MRSFRWRANAPAHRPAVRSLIAALSPCQFPGADAEVPKETGDGSAADARDQEQRFAYRCRDPDPPGRAPGGHEKIRQRLRATASGVAEDGAGSLFVLDEPCGVRKAVFPACGEGAGGDRSGIGLPPRPPWRGRDETDVRKIGCDGRADPQPERRSSTGTVPVRTGTARRRHNHGHRHNGEGYDHALVRRPVRARIHLEPQETDTLMARWSRTLQSVAGVLMLSIIPAAASAADLEVEVSGKVSIESRLHPDRALHPGQRSHASGFTAKPEFYAEDGEGLSVTVSPFVRYDAGDPRRTHADLREAFLLLHGEAEDGEWELRLGVDRVTWGVAEVRNIVDIVNQTDLIEHPDGKTKLGQLMAHGTWSADWGVAELLLMPWHRKRTYPGRAGRLRSGLIVDNDEATYDSADKERHLDWALRYSGSFGPLELGLSYFDGQSREPSLRPAKFLYVPGLGPVPTALQPHYEKVRQIGLDGQITTGPWLLKLEAVRHYGASTRSSPEHPFGEEEDYTAWIVGGEYSIYSVMDTEAEITLLAEWHGDGRGPARATNAFQNDLFLAVRLALNDVESTEFTLSMLEDLEIPGRSFGLEARRWLTDDWSFKLEGTLFQGITSPRDAFYEVRRDSYLGLNFVYSF